MDVRNSIRPTLVRQTMTPTSFLLCLLILTLAEVTWAIHLEHVEIPGVVAVGESPTLVCDVDLEPGELYSVKWYKDNDEFYRFMPKREPNTQTYPVEGINVDKSRSTGESVVLRSVTTATAGFFRCEVSGEGPSFPSVSDGGHLTVVIPPKRKPEIFGGVSDGNVELNCTTDASRPAAQIKWFVNGAQVPDELIEESSVRKAGNGLETSFSVLQLSSENRDYFPRSGAVTIACEAVIPTPSMPPDFQRDMAGISRTAEEERTQFNRRVASAAEAEQVVAARPKLHHRNAALVSNLVLRKEIIVYVSSGSRAVDASLVLLISVLISAVSFS